MTEEAELTQEREELNRRLAAEEYKTLIDVILGGTGRLVQKLTRSPRRPSFWYSAVAITLLWVLAVTVVSMLGGDDFEALIAFFGSENLLLVPVVMVALVFAFVIGHKVYIGIVFRTLYEHLLDAIEAVADLADLQGWLTALCNTKRALLLSLVFSIVIGAYSTILLSSIVGGFIGFGPTMLFVIGDFQLGITVYLLFLFLVLPVRLRRYRFRLYASDPSSSEVIDHLSGLFSNFVYLVAVLATLGTLVMAVFGFLTLSVIIIAVLVVWGPLVVLFVINQYALSKIITRAKWTKLNEVQAKIEALETQEDILSEKTLGHLGRLMDYHDRIKATRDSALDLRAALNFLNSLLIPLLALILANLDKVLGLFV